MKDEVVLIFEEACSRIGKASAGQGRISEEALLRIGKAGSDFAQRHEAIFAEMSKNIDAKLKGGMRRTNVDPV